MPRFLRSCLVFIASLCLLAVHHCAAASGDARTGIGVFDTLYIAGKNGLTVHGDVVLKGAHVLGDGELQLRGKVDARIVSHRSEVNHLTITTSANVRLEGELAVNKSFTVRSGAFDTSDGILDVSHSATVRLLNGSQVIHSKLVAGRQQKGRYSHDYGNMFKAVLSKSSALVLRFHLLARPIPEVNFSRLQEGYGLVALVPPEIISCPYSV